MGYGSRERGGGGDSGERGQREKGRKRTERDREEEDREKMGTKGIGEEEDRKYGEEEIEGRGEQRE